MLAIGHEIFSDFLPIVCMNSRNASPSFPSRAAGIISWTPWIARRYYSSFKLGLDGHSNGVGQIAVKAKDVDMDLVYEGIRLTPGHIYAAGVKKMFTPADFDLNKIMPDLADIAAEANHMV